ncbi:hypothetical protein AB0O22_26745 [Streptomyces sp. NPDC091204]|uniref:hypothetical protein n=1 Tax=Streptomyces sp. NPDC091204 TaxID=3155299 RepID=UPI00344A72AD
MPVRHLHLIGHPEPFTAEVVRVVRQTEDLPLPEVMKLYRPLYGVAGIEFRMHRSTLHNSLYRSDDEWLVNTQVYCVSARLTPVLHLRRVAGAELASTYQQSFEKVWDEAVPIERSS